MAWCVGKFLSFFSRVINALEECGRCENENLSESAIFGQIKNSNNETVNNVSFL